MIVLKRLLTLGLDNDPLWVRLYVHKMDEVWTAMTVGDDELPPEPGALKRLAFFGETREEPERGAKAYLGASEPEN